MLKRMGQNLSRKDTLFNFGGSDQIFRAEFWVHHPSSHYTGNKTAGVLERAWWHFSATLEFLRELDHTKNKLLFFFGKLNLKVWTSM